MAGVLAEVARLGLGWPLVFLGMMVQTSTVVAPCFPFTFFPFGCLALPIQNSPSGRVTAIHLRRLADLLPSSRLQKPSMRSLLWCRKTSTGGRARSQCGRSWTGSRNPLARGTTCRCRHRAAAAAPLPPGTRLPAPPEPWCSHPQGLV